MTTPFPQTFQIQGGHIGGYDACATTTSATAITQQVSNSNNQAQRWSHNPQTKQLTNGNPATAGKCLSLTSGDELCMQSCDANKAEQRWEPRDQRDLHFGPFTALWNLGRDRPVYRGASNYMILPAPYLAQVGSGDFSFPQV
jgi:hypothetical protein